MESYWKDGKPKQRCIACLGRLDRLKESGQLEKIGMALRKYSGKNKNYFNIRKLREKDRKICGAPRVIKKIWDKFKLEKLFNEIKGNRRIKFDFFSAVFLRKNSKSKFSKKDIVKKLHPIFYKIPQTQ